ncbi:MAG: DNA-directed RNA polymerase subunit beta' [Alphaproteobacteria bacterium]|nr:MAG: DNA-directed RNA polymerase subunit beta' [Alphaproteobacteria bacterium]
MRVFESISQGYDVFDQPGVTESFRVLLYELRSLCLNVECLSCVNGDLVEQDLSSLSTLDALRISIASPQKIREWSYGQVTKAETIHYRTLKPDPDGLFSARIFGPLTDYECLCGKYKKITSRGVVCEKCGVEVTLSKVRRERMGHIELAAPVAHIWFAKALPSRIGVMLDLSSKELDSILNFERYIVIEPATSPYAKSTLLNEIEYETALEEYEEDGFEAQTGAEAIEKLLQDINLEEEIKSIKEMLTDSSQESKRKKLIRKLKILEGFYKSNTRPEVCILRTLPVLPPELRPLVLLDGGRFASSDVNDLYRRVINRNNRLKKLIAISSPAVILRNEIRMLQESVDALFDNNRKSRPIASVNSKRPYKSISDSLKGKQGRFRQNLLGKRVDYSGRSVIVVGPELRLDQCGLPKEMALELFKPFVTARLELRGFAPTYKSAKQMIEHKRPEVWDVLDECIQDHVVLLNRAPTLHRLSIQAFNPVLVDGKAIRLHPLVCTAYNADFDGDQMAIHVPLSIEAQLEARMLMMSTKCLLNPANGSPIVKPSKDMVFGIYYLTLMLDKKPDLIFRDIEEVELAFEFKRIHLHTPIRAYVNGSMVTTTLGRLKLYEILPQGYDVSFAVVNRVMNTKAIAELVELIYETYQEEQIMIFLDKLMNIGFLYATLSGASFGKDDLIVPEEKHEFIAETRKLVEEYKKQYMEGLITNEERYNKAISAWYQCTNEVSKVMMERMSRRDKDGEMNPVFMMSDSGARGNPMQLKQLSGMRGNTTRPDGSVQEEPIENSFKEGLTVYEFLLAAEGGRKGLVDVALKTANSGYLTRRLVGVAQDCTVQHSDCGTTNGLMVQAVVQSGTLVVGLAKQLYGRVLSKDVKLNIKMVQELREKFATLAVNNDYTQFVAEGIKGVENGDLSNYITISAGTVIDKPLAKFIEEVGFEQVEVRSPVTCDNTDTTVCMHCYGYDLAKFDGEKMVQDAESIGVVAAQSIGEPGTQLTMRTFHLGGVVQNIGEDSHIDAQSDCVVVLDNVKVIDKGEYSVVMSRNSELKLKTGEKSISYSIPYGAKIFVQDGDMASFGTRIAEWDPYNVVVLAEYDGIIKYGDLIEGTSLKTNIDEATGMRNYIVTDWSRISRKASLNPNLRLEYGKGEEYHYSLGINDIIVVEDNERVEAGDVIITRSQALQKTKDIVGGLPRIEELFEARHAKSPSVMSETDGSVRFNTDSRQKKYMIVTDKDGNEIEYSIPKDQYVLVHDGEVVSKGQILVDGNVSHHDLLRILGVKAMAKSFIDEVQKVYRMQGIEINDKHIEVILRRMLSQAEVLDPSSSVFLVGDVVDITEINAINKLLSEQGKPLIKFRRILQGITKISTNEGNSFLASASFQDTSRILTDAALSHKVDWVLGITESLMVGSLITAGTGACTRREEIRLKQDIMQQMMHDFITD